MCVVRCLNRATGSGILENMVHSRATYSKAQIWSWPMSPEVFRNSWNQAPRAACPGREFSVLNCIPWHWCRGSSHPKEYQGLKHSNFPLLNKNYLRRTYLHKGTLSLPDNYFCVLHCFIKSFHYLPFYHILLNTKNIKISGKRKYFWLLVNYAFLYATL